MFDPAHAYYIGNLNSRKPFKVRSAGCYKSAYIKKSKLITLIIPFVVMIYFSKVDLKTILTYPIICQEVGLVKWSFKNLLCQLTYFLHCRNPFL